MMGFFSSAVGATKRPRGASVGEEIPEDTEPDDTSILYVSSLPFHSHVTSDIFPIHLPFPLPLSHFHPSSIMLVNTQTVTSYTDFRDEDEGSIVSSLISQLRSAMSPTAISSSSPKLKFRRSGFLQSGDGLVQSDFPNLRAGATKYVGTNHRLHGTSRSNFWVSHRFDRLNPVDPAR
jgi:hypothetical protein